MSQQQAVQPIVLKQENGEVVLKLVLENPKHDTQALALDNPKDNKIYVDLNHSTDWVVASSIIASCVISFIGFLITVYVVKKSTEAQIISNRNVIQSQSEIQKSQFIFEFNRLKVLELKKYFSEYLYLINTIDTLQRAFYTTIKQEVSLGKNLSSCIESYSSKYDEICKFIEEMEKLVAPLALLLNMDNIEEENIYFKLREINSLINHNMTAKYIKNPNNYSKSISDKIDQIENMIRSLIFEKERAI